MMTDGFAQLAYVALLLVLVGSAILGRRLPAGRMLVYLLVWAAVIGGVFLLFRDGIDRPPAVPAQFDLT